ncbi:uncharacterized protein LOC130894198 isoform X1 [Diorhabda carinulata]|uniref:uncharacterized protein LOC130894198 isoform X1 n=1 Tax=Diorhabda carinulata TaxID=1163345 RepID=UPI0025A0B2DD|nr:uncharacterized protein LOC130894198 isoform X1 [Diorhabda carinulata]
MDLSSNDLEEYVEKLENLFLIEKSNKKYRHELTLLIENISCELNTSRKNENSLRDDLKKLIECGDLDINQKYVQAEEKCNKQQIEIVLLTKKIEELRNQTNLDLEIQKNEFLNKIKNIEETLGSQIVNLNSQLESQKICYETKEQELYNEMQMMQAASALEWDEKESNYKKQISDSANNLRFLQSRIRSMQCEINQLKTQLSILKCPPIDNNMYPQETPIRQFKNQLVQKKLYETSCNEYIDENQVCTNVTENTNEYCRPTSSASTVEIIRSSQTHTYKPNITDLDEIAQQEGTSNGKSQKKLSNSIETTNSSNFKPINQLYAPVVFKGKNRARANNLLPPLKQLGNSGLNNMNKKEMQRKKRKLYDPNSYDYLST